ncbi:hypothetical protein [Clostridium sp. C8-1-8]|uniref:hypothetical protein n=1 Tax=Clostridium sp. C8-1-8 TaxID=2698831 RepID=UPI00136B7F30|nr:hypothetical protein [Clostridium sp. C8-1-8]
MRGTKIIIGIIILSVLGGALLFTNAMRVNVSLIGSGLGTEIKVKGIKEANCFTFDEKRNIYFGSDNGIELYRTDGKSEYVIKESNININSIGYEDGKLYYVEGSNLISYDIKNKIKSELINNLPDKGDYNKCKLIICKDDIYIAIGAATNSGIVSGKEAVPDSSPMDITLKGSNYGEEPTGAFSKYGVKTKNGQVIKKSFPGNASVIKYSIKNNKAELFASGIRNIEGWDYNSEGSLMAIVGGMEDRGLRPIQGDTDYIYELKKDIWYGWPDFSGGDPLDSPKFTDDKGKAVKLLLSKWPMVSPPAPAYVYKDVGAISSLIIDKNGIIKGKDSSFFYDKKQQAIYNLDKNGLISKVFKFRSNAQIKDIKLIDNSLYILDKNNGVLYEAQKQKKNLMSSSSSLVFFSLCVIILAMGIIIVKFSIKIK